MERERVKKKGGGTKPGGAVMISGTSVHPPIDDDPVTMSDTNDLVMEYTDIFEPSGDDKVVDVEDRDAVEESSDTEIVGHTSEKTQYSKYDNESDLDMHEGPPPLESEDEYEYDDSDLCFTPPQAGSQDPLVLSPAKSISSERDSISDKVPFGNQNSRSHASRQGSEDSDLGYREGPPPLDSEDESEAADQNVDVNGVEEEEEECDQNEDYKDDVSENEEPEETNEQDRNLDQEDEEEEVCVPLEVVDSLEGAPQETGLLLGNDSPNETSKTPEIEPVPEELADSQQLIHSPERVSSPFEGEGEQEEEIVSDVGSVERDASPVFGKGDSESDDMFSNPDEPLLEDEGHNDAKSAEVSSPDEEPENQPLLRESKEQKQEMPTNILNSEEELDEDSKGSMENLLSNKDKEDRYEKLNYEAKMVESPDDDESGEENEGLLNREVKPNKEIFRKQKTLQSSVFRSPKGKSNATEAHKNVHNLRGTTKPDRGAASNVEKGRSSDVVKVEKKRADTSRPGSVASSASRTSSSENLASKMKPATRSGSAVTTSATVHTEKKPREKKQIVGAREERKVPREVPQKGSHDVRRSAPGIAVKEGSKKPPSSDSAPGKSQRTRERGTREGDSNNTRMKEENGKFRQNDKQPKSKRTGADELHRAQKASSENLASNKRSTEKLAKGQAISETASNNGEVRKKTKPKKAVTKSIAVGTDEESLDDGISQEERSPRAPDPHQTQAYRSKGLNHDSKSKRHPYEEKSTGTTSIGVHNHHAKTRGAHGKHDRGKHVWLCRDDEIHKLIAQKASLLKEYESGSLAGRKVFSGQKRRARSHDSLDAAVPDVSFAGSKQRPRPTRPMSEVIPEHAPYNSRKRENRRSLQHRYSGTSSEDSDDITDRNAATRRAQGSSGTFSVGMASRDLSKREQQEENDSDHEETCEYCQAEKAARKAQERDLAWEGPHHPRNLLLGVVYTAKYLGSSQIMSPQSPNRAVRMQQAQEAVGRIKVPEGEDQPTTDVDIFISTERIKVVNSQNKEVMMDHALRTVSFIADIGDVLVLMARRPPGEQENPLETKPSSAQILASVGKAETDPKMIKITCHVFQADEAQIIAKSIGQAFNVAYQEFLKTNGISEDSVEDAEYNCVLEAQKILGEDLSLLSDESKSREVTVNKKPGEALGVMIVESGWGSMIPTAIIAHLAKDGPAAKSGRVNVGDQILSVNNTSLVGLPLVECQNVIKNSRAGTKVMLKMVSCPPTVQVVVNRPDTKYQLGFSVQNGMICSLMRGSIAERGGVRVGHRIIEINGESVVATSHQHIVDLLATTIGEIRMKTMPASMYRLLVGLDTPQHI